MVSPQHTRQARFAEFLSCIIERFGYAVGVDSERVSREEPAFLYRAIPFLEESHYSACGIEPFKSVIAAEAQSGEMPTICVAQAPHSVVIFGKEERGVGTVSRILVKELVHRSQQALRLIQSGWTVAAE